MGGKEYGSDLTGTPLNRPQLLNEMGWIGLFWAWRQPLDATRMKWMRPAWRGENGEWWGSHHGVVTSLDAARVRCGTPRVRTSKVVSLVWFSPDFVCFRLFPAK